MKQSWFEQVPADCPGVYSSEYCADDDKVKPDFGMIPVYLSLCSCTLSMLGSVLMILPYILWKDVRHGLRAILTYLAIADFFTAFSYTIASFNYIYYHHHSKHDFIASCSLFSSLCQIQAFISSWASYSSFWWTLIFAFYLYRLIRIGNNETFVKYFPVLHVFVWGSPMLVMLPLLITGSLGYSLFSAGGWCFVSSDKQIGELKYANYELSVGTIFKILAGGKAVEIAVYVAVFVLYGISSVDIHRKKKEIIMEDEAVSLPYKKFLKQIEVKMYIIPFAFVLVRLWGTLQFIFSIAVFARGGTVDETGCVSPAIFYTYYVLECLQSVGDGGQGWCNAVLYIGFSPTIRARLLSLVTSSVKKCFRNTVRLYNGGSIQKTDEQEALFKNQLTVEL